MCVFFCKIGILLWGITPPRYQWDPCTLYLWNAMYENHDLKIGEKIVGQFVDSFQKDYKENEPIKINEENYIGKSEKEKKSEFFWSILF